MYSKELINKLKAKNIEELDLIEISIGDSKLQGTLMPRDSRNPDNLVLKLKSGYNAGINQQGITGFELIRKAEKKGPAAAPVIPKPGSEKKFSLIGCGGTIVSKVEYLTGAAFPSVKPEEIIAEFPELSEFGSFQGRLLFNLLSEDMTHEHWKIIAEEVYSHVKSGSHGVVLMHGTDILGFTSAALSFMLQDLPVPVVLVGAQRSSDRGSSDNKTNLISAVTAADSQIAEVGVCMHNSMNDDLCAFHRGTRVRKMHTSRRDAFKSIGINPLAYVDPAKKSITYNYQDYRKRSSSEVIKDTRMNNNVGLVYTYPGVQRKFFKFLSEYDGVVIAGTGLGHVPTNAFNDPNSINVIQEIKETIASGVPVYVAPQTIYGRINMNVYTAGRMLLNAGVMGNNCDMIPETALVKLMWVLGHTQDLEKVKEEMERNIAGEITHSSEIVD